MAEPSDPEGHDQDPPRPAVPYGSGPTAAIPTSPLTAPTSTSEPGSSVTPSPIVSWEPSGGARPPAVAPDAASGPGAIVGWAAPPGATIPGRAAPVPGYAIAGVGRRLGAFILDNVLLLGITLIATIVLFLFVPGLVADDRDSTLAVALVYIAASLLLIVGTWTGSGRASPGMRAAGLQVIAARGGTLPIGRALARWLLLGYPVGALSALPEFTNLLSVLAFVWALALLITTATNALGQGIHDRLAGSLVVRPTATHGPPA